MRYYCDLQVFQTRSGSPSVTPITYHIRFFFLLFFSSLYYYVTYYVGPIRILILRVDDLSLSLFLFPFATLSYIICILTITRKEDKTCRIFLSLSLARVTEA